MEEIFRISFFVLVLAVLFVWDLRHGILPDAITLPSIAVVVVWNLVGGHVQLWSMVAGASVVGGFFFIQFLVSHGRWIGGGDIRMGALMGAMLGLWPAVIATYVAYVVGAIIGGALLLRGTHQRTSALPFGTFLAVGSGIALLWGERMVVWYTQWMR
ncbi:MAG: A24 family peptidase [Patescibacteria group bacterium]